jgi:uncharacterized protein
MTGRRAATVVVGGGPAGLAAGCALHDRGVDHVVVERGKALSDRRHDAADDLAVGVGGAGLFSDGKFSYYPSGTKLYALANRRRLRGAYEWCIRTLEDAGIATEPFPTARGNAPDVEGLKRYPSHYADLERRKDLIEDIARSLGSSLVTGSRVAQLEADGTSYEIDVVGELGTTQVEADSVVLATGRFGPLDDGLAAAVPRIPIRFEIGVRVECKSSVGFLSRLEIPDVKRVWPVDGVEVRTFCTCRNGEVWNIPVAGLSALSGRADGAPTAFSNFGLLARFSGARFADGAERWGELTSGPLGAGVAVYEPLADFLECGRRSHRARIEERPWFPRHAFAPGRIRDVVGPSLHEILAKALANLVGWSPSLQDDATMCLFPAVEGIGHYPSVDAGLRVDGQRIWCAGDVVGAFRGLVPALVSGYYAGLCAADAVSPTRRRRALRSQPSRVS